MALRLEILIDGRGRPDLAAAWQSLVIRDRAGVEEDSATLVLAAPPPAEVDVPRSRARIAFRIGADRAPLGPGLVATAVSGDTRRGTVTVEAASTDARESLRSARDASWDGLTLGQIVARIADRAGLNALVSDDARDRRPAATLQTGESDQQFLRRAAQAAGARLLVRGDDLIVLAAERGLVDAGRAGAVDVDIAAEGAWARWRHSLRQPAASVLAHHEDPAVGPRRGYLAGSGEPLQVLPDVYPDRASAAEAAEAALRRSRRGVDEVEIETGLRPDLHALQPIRVAGLPRGLGAGMLAHAVVHRLPAGGAATTTITARPI